MIVDTMQKLIAATMIKWSKDSLISRQELVRQMFSLLYRQYDALGEVSLNSITALYITAMPDTRHHISMSKGSISH